MIDSPSKYRARASVLMGSSGRQSAGLAAAKTSGILGALAAGTDAEKKTSTHTPENLTLSDMPRVLHKRAGGLAEGGMRRISVGCLVVLVWLGAGAHMALAGGERYSGGGGQMPGGRPGMGGGVGKPGGEMPSTPAVDNPDAAAKKAFNSGVKSLNRAREFEEVAAKATNPDKKANAMDKVGDAYGRALDQFTEALSNQGDMVEAWNYAGYVHLRLGAYSESIDDYNHTLALKPDLLEAVEHRGEAYMAVDRLEDAKAAALDLVN